MTDRSPFMPDESSESLHPTPMDSGQNDASANSEEKQKEGAVWESTAREVPPQEVAPQASAEANAGPNAQGAAGYAPAQYTQYPTAPGQNLPPYMQARQMGAPGQPYTVYPYAPGAHAKKEKRKKAKNPARRRVAALLCVCLLGSGLFGFGGAYLANRVPFGGSGGTGNGAVIYQSTRSPAGESGEAMSIADVAAGAKQSVVEIRTESISTSAFLRNMITEGAGSGVILSQDGYIITNKHVVSGATTVTVRLSDGKEYVAKVVGADSQTDLAVLKIDATDLKPVVLGTSANLMVGESAIAIGNPLGELGGTVTEGIISALDREITIEGETMNLLQTSAAINPGNSGGGLFNRYGELVGVVNAKSSGTDIEGLGFAIPIDTAKSVIEDIISKGYVTGRVEAGFSLLEVTDAMTARMYRLNALGLYIMESKSPDFQSGDRIIAMDGKEITDVAGFKAALAAHSVGDVVEISVIRSGSTLNISLTLKEKTE